jgi:hypothetical protein
MIKLNLIADDSKGIDVLYINVPMIQNIGPLPCVIKSMVLDTKIPLRREVLDLGSISVSEV